MKPASPSRSAPFFHPNNKSNPMKLLVLNGPPHSGKDTLADFAVGFDDFTKFRFATPLKMGCHALLGDDLDVEKYEGPAKEIPQDDLLGEIPREWYIEISEKVLKPKFGDDVFGRIAVKYLKRLSPTHLVVTDSGFWDELFPLVQEFGNLNVLVCRLHRAGCSYVGDSRNYLDSAMLEAHEIPYMDNHIIEGDVPGTYRVITEKMIELEWVKYGT